MQADTSVRALIRRYCAAWGDGDRDGWLSTFAADGTQEDPVGDGVRRGRDEIGVFWDDAFAVYSSLEIRERAIHVTGNEAALEWTIVAAHGDEWVVFDGVDVFTFADGPLIGTVRAFWEREGRTRTKVKP